jgi:hypothetical protein
MIGIDGGSMSNQFIALTTKKGRISAALLVELPGIEPVVEIALTCVNTESKYAKRREITRNDLRIRKRC